MVTLEELSKQYAFWKYFFELSSIPRPSFNQEPACEWVVKYAEEWELSYRRDDYGNIVVKVPANDETLVEAPLIAIQAHLDMVCEKNEIEHDFTQDSLQLYVTEDKKYVKAKDTTLGADDGIGVAYQMSLMDPNCEYPHGPLEMLFTLDEEVGLVGATHLGKGMLEAEYLINIDNSEEGMCCIGCAGGKNVIAELPVLRKPVKKEYAPFELRVKGLAGGHSGSDIFELRANAIKLTERVLSAIRNEVDISVQGFQSGDKLNAIPREAKVQLFAKREDIEKINTILTELQKAIRSELLDVDKNFTISLDDCKDQNSTAKLVLTESSLSRIIKLIRYCPNGVYMRRNNKSTGTTLSTNLASIQTNDTSIVFYNSTRFANKYGAKYIVEIVETFFQDVDAKCSESKGYDAWEATDNSVLKKLFCTQYEFYTNKKAVTDVIHGGLECGIIKSTQNNNLDVISIGPTVDFLHSPSERMHIESCNTMWHVIGKMLGSTKELT